MPESEGESAALGNFRGSKPWTIATLRATGQSLRRDLREVKPLPANPVPEADTGSAEIIPMEFTATAEHAPTASLCGSLGYTFWAINRVAWAGDTPDPVAPLAELRLGRSYIFRLSNRTPHAHPMHLHGMSFRVLNSNKRQIVRQMTDTVLLLPDETADVALVADNPGDWMLHCHIIEHQKSGMSSFVRVA